jgi:hypothetical protein
MLSHKLRRKCYKNVIKTLRKYKKEKLRTKLLDVIKEDEKSYAFIEKCQKKGHKKAALKKCV